MGTKRKTYRLCRGDVIDVEEFHDGRYGAPGEKRQKRKKPTREDMQKVNQMNKERLARQKLLQYFQPGDYFATLTYRVESRTKDMKEAVKHFGDMMKKVRPEYRKRGSPLYWIRNIEKGTRGAWHIHLVITALPETAGILEKAWPHGGVYIEQIKKSKYYDEDFSRMAAYMTKSEHTREKKADGSEAKPRIRESSYSTSRNMPLPEPHVEKLVRWQQEPKPKKGYYIARSHEGINPATGYKYRRYTMIRLNRRI